jgi:hypothetical protein
MKTLDLATMENIQGGGGCSSCGGLNISLLLLLGLGGCSLLGLGLGISIGL